MFALSAPWRCTMSSFKQINKSSRALNSNIWHLLQHLRILGPFVLFCFFKLTSWEQTLSDADCVGLWPIDQSTCDVCTHSESSQTQSSVAAPSEAVEAVSSSVCHILKQTGKTKKKIVEKWQRFLSFLQVYEKNYNNYMVPTYYTSSAEPHKRGCTGSECEMKVPSSGCVVG